MLDSNQEENIYQSTSLAIQCIPTTMCMLGNTILILINVYHNKRSVNQLFGMGLGTIFSNIIGYLLISSMNIGLACQISKAVSKKRYRIIGIYYQRALLVNFIACITIITPLLYISNKILVFYSDIPSYEILQTTSQYLFQLVPSIYAFAYFDTTRVYLQAQSVRVPPMLILLIAIFFHFELSKILIGSVNSKGMGAAWAKNFTDFLCAVAIYLYIVFSKIVEKSWKQWDIQCLTNWGRHLKNFSTIGLTTYVEAIMFLIFSLLGSRLSQQELAAHIGFVNWTQILFLIFLGLKQGILTQVSEILMRERYLEAEKKVKYGIRATLILSFVINLLILVYKKEVAQFFLDQKQEDISNFNKNFWIFQISNILDSIQLSISGVLKGIHKQPPIIKTGIICYSIGLLYSYKRSETLEGLWMGWCIGLFLNLICCLFYLWRQLRIWKILQKQLRPSKMS